LFVFCIPNVYVLFLVRNVYDVLIRKNNRTKGVLLWYHGRRTLLQGNHKKQNISRSRCMMHVED